jgi:hypothetical protein
MGVKTYGLVTKVNFVVNFKQLEVVQQFYDVQKSIDQYVKFIIVIIDVDYRIIY